jgi:hypothetical protein
MTSLADLTAAGVTVSLGGEDYELLPLRLIDWAEAARYLRQLQRPVLEVLREWLPELGPAEQRAVLEIAYRDARLGDALPLEEIEAWFQTPPGRVYQHWLMLRQRRPALTLGDVETLLRSAEMAELTELAKAAASEGGFRENENENPSPSPLPEVAGQNATPSRGDNGSSP